MALELRHLRLLLAAADQGSFGRAAKAVGVGQPALSRAIQDLENEIGGSLFERDHAGVRPTLAGRQFIDRVRPLLDGLDCKVALKRDPGFASNRDPFVPAVRAAVRGAIA